MTSFTDTFKGFNQSSSGLCRVIDIGIVDFNAAADHETSVVQKEPVRTLVTMSKMLVDQYWGEGVSIAGRIFSSPVAESRPASASPELAIPSDITPPRIQKAISRRTHNILPEAVEAMR